MPSIWDIVHQRQRQQCQGREENFLQTGTVLRKNGTRIIVGLASHETECEVAVGANLEINDIVWVARSRGVPVIIGVSGKNAETL